MILPLALIAVQQVPSGEPPAQEIVVVGERLKAWRGKFSIRGARSTCKTTASTGDKEIDAVGCQSMLDCLPPLQPRIVASDAKGLDTGVRQEMKTALRRDLTSCVKQRNDMLVAELVERRFQARQGKKNAQD